MQSKLKRLHKLRSDIKRPVAINNTVPPGKNSEKIMDYLAPLFKNVGCGVRKVAIPKESISGDEGRFNLVSHRRSIGKPSLILYKHADVEPVTGWDGLIPKVEGNKLYGRGTSDDKGNIVAMLMMLDKVKGKTPTVLATGMLC